MLWIAKLHSNKNGNSHTARSVLCIIMSLPMLIFIEILLPCVWQLNEIIKIEIGVVT
jgi:hypothetical protein